MRGAEALLQSPADSVSEIAAACGFDSPSNFSMMFRRYYNCTPREYRRSRAE
jgi:AraC-like DNA-binding protein